MEFPTGGLRADRTAFVVLFVVLLVFTVALVIVSIPAGAYAVYSDRLSPTLSYNSPFMTYLWIGPAADFPPFGTSIGVMFALVTSIYVVFLVYSLLQSEGSIRAVSRSLREGVSALLSSPFIAILIAIGVLNFGGTLIDSIVTATGSPIGGPTSQSDPLALLAGFAYSPLVEELGFRVLLIGVVAFILSISRPWKVALGALWRPSKAIEGLAVGSGASFIIWAATGLSAVTFGACHVVCGSTWDIGKLPEATFGGLVLGYLYVRYGFHAAVLAHWGVDYFGSALGFFGQAAYGIPWYSGTTEYTGQLLVDLDMLYLFGLVSFLLAVYLGLRKVVEWRSGRGPDELDKVAVGGGGVGP